MIQVLPSRKCKSTNSVLGWRFSEEMFEVPTVHVLDVILPSMIESLRPDTTGVRLLRPTYSSIGKTITIPVRSLFRSVLSTTNSTRLEGKYNGRRRALSLSFISEGTRHGTRRNVKKKKKRNIYISLKYKI